MQIKNSYCVINSILFFLKGGKYESNNTTSMVEQNHGIIVTISKENTALAMFSAKLIELRNKFEVETI